MIKSHYSEFEIIFWQELEKIILDKYPNIKLISDSPDRFSIEKINEKASENQYGVIFDKLQLLLITKDKSSVIKIIKDPSIVEKNALMVLETTIPFKFIKRLESQEEAEFMATSILEFIIGD